MEQLEQVEHVEHVDLEHHKNPLWNRWNRWNLLWNKWNWCNMCNWRTNRSYMAEIERNFQFLIFNIANYKTHSPECVVFQEFEEVEEFGTPLCSLPPPRVR